MCRIRSACCARAASGHATAALPITLMKSRRRIPFAQVQDEPERLQQGNAGNGMGLKARCAAASRAAQVLNIRGNSEPNWGLARLNGKFGPRSYSLPLFVGPSGEL